MSDPILPAAGNRMTYARVLTPPEGFAFHSGVATTYSLSLPAFLTLPTILLSQAGDELAACLADGSRAKLLAGIHRVADRLTVFCQQCRITAVDGLPEVMGLVEDCVIEVVPGGKAPGAFHPKVWLLRFTDGDEVRFRLAVLSRNITDDLSWDLCAAFDGRQKGSGRADDPVAYFIEELCHLAGRQGRRGRLDAIRGLAQEVRAVEWQPMPGFGKPRFRPSGIRAKAPRWSVPKCERLLVVSPFVDASTLQALGNGMPMTLVSRQESLDAAFLGKPIPFAQAYTFDADPTGDTTDEPVGLRGLHAKAYAWQRSGQITLAIGSANATRPAFEGRNIEFMVEMDAVGAAGRRLVSWFSGEGNPFARLLQPYEPPATDELPGDPPRDWRSVRRAIMACGLSLQCQVDGSQVRVDLCAQHTISADELHEVAALSVWMVTANHADRVSVLPGLRQGQPVRLMPSCPLAQVTGFLVVEAVGSDGDADRFTINIPVKGLDDEARRAAIVRTILGTEAEFLRYLLLALGGTDAVGTPGAGAKGIPADQPPERLFAEWSATSLLESIMRTLAREPERLLTIRALLRDLSADEQTARVVPPGFRVLWRQVERVLKPMLTEQRSKGRRR